MVGGYQIIDLKGVKLTSGTAKSSPLFTGLYDKIEGTKKRCIITNLVVGNTEYKDFEVLFAVSGQTFIGRHVYTSTSTITVTIASDDKVTAIIS